MSRSSLGCQRSFARTLVVVPPPSSPVLQPRYFAVGLLQRQRARQCGRAVLGHLAGEIQHVDVAILLLEAAGQTQKEVGRQTEVHRAGRLHQVARTVGQREMARAVAGGVLGVDLDRAADRGVTRQRALRAAQDFDPVDVGQVKARTDHGRVIDIIDIQADGGRAGEAVLILQHAAHCDDRAARLRQGGCE